MSFYQYIVSYYDAIFPLNSAQVSFVESGFRVMHGKRILDMGCGTGSLAIMLGRHGASVRGIDLDDQMIAAANAKKPQALNVLFSVADMLGVADAKIGEGFDVILSFGNSLAHLSGVQKVEEVVRQTSKLLKNSGKLMFQIVNYDRILSESVVELPLIDNSVVKFERTYSKPDEKKVDFESVLTIKDSGESYMQSVPLLIITKGTLESILLKYFNDIKWWGSFKKDEWSVNSFHTIVEACNI